MNDVVALVAHHGYLIIFLVVLAVSAVWFTLVRRQEREV